MKSHTWLLVFAAALSLAASAFAQRGMGRGPMHYDAATEVTLSGTVDEVKQTQSPGRGMGGVHLIFSTATGPLEVLLGPASFVSSKDFSFAKGDALTVTGSKITTAGQEVVVAREITKGDRTLTLRDARGFPLWSGRGGR